MVASSTAGVHEPQRVRGRLQRQSERFVTVSGQPLVELTSPLLDGGEIVRIQFWGINTTLFFSSFRIVKLPGSFRNLARSVVRVF